MYILSMVRGTLLLYLNEHVIDDEEEVDAFRGHDEDVQATGGLVEADGLQLAPVLEGSWPG